ncbi:MAG: GNAT family N-acetyltransferase [Desulfuromonadales bacterium]
MTPALCYESVRKIELSDNVALFDCGHPALNQFLQRFAVVNQKANSAQTYVCCERGTPVVAGFYSLVVGSVEPSTASIRAAKGLAQHPVPVMILARLAIDQNHQSAGLGRALLKDALLRTVQAASIAGIRAVLVHVKDDAARTWYLHWGFEPSPTDPYHLFLIMKDLAKLVTPSTNSHQSP